MDLDEYAARAAATDHTKDPDRGLQIVLHGLAGEAALCGQRGEKVVPGGPAAGRTRGTRRGGVGRPFFDGYWNDARFQRKKPDRRGSLKYRYGVNVYRSPGGSWVQEDCRHSIDDGTPNPDHVKRDTSADAVLISSRFTYWGGRGPVLPAKLRDWDGLDIGDPGRDHTYKPYPPEMIEAFIRWVDGLPSGLQAPPIEW